MYHHIAAAEDEADKTVTAAVSIKQQKMETEMQTKS